MTPDPDQLHTRRTVLLRHTLAPGDAHIDWMIGPVRPFDVDDRVLLTWRLGLETAELFDGERGFVFEGARLPDHRGRYLDYEGEISEGRGRVDRLGAGQATILELADHLVHLRLDLGRSWAITGERVGSAPLSQDDGAPPLGLWRFQAEAEGHRGG